MNSKSFLKSILIFTERFSQLLISFFFFFCFSFVFSFNKKFQSKNNEFIDTWTKYELVNWNWSSKQSNFFFKFSWNFFLCLHIWKEKKKIIWRHWKKLIEKRKKIVSQLKINNLNNKINSIFNSNPSFFNHFSFSCYVIHFLLKKKKISNIFKLKKWNSNLKSITISIVCVNFQLWNFHLL